MPTTVQIRTDDTAWIARVGARIVDEDRVAVEVDRVETFTFAGHEHLRFDLQSLGKLPRRWGSRWTVCPADWVR